MNQADKLARMQLWAPKRRAVETRVRSALRHNTPRSVSDIWERVGFWTQETVAECLCELSRLRIIVDHGDGRYSA